MSNEIGMVDEREQKTERPAIPPVLQIWLGSEQNRKRLGHDLITHPVHTQTHKLT